MSPRRPAKIAGFQLHGNLPELLETIEGLRPHPDNPREGDVDLVAASMAVNGVYRPVVAQRSTGYVLAGNHTFLALKSRGADRVPVVWVDVDDETARRILLADNRTGDLGGYDPGAMYRHLSTFGADELGGTGWEELDVRDLEAQLAPDPPDEDGEDELEDELEDDTDDRWDRSSSMKAAVFVFDLETFVEVVEALEELAVVLDTDSNSATVVKLLEERSGEQAPHGGQG